MCSYYNFYLKVICKNLFLVFFGFIPNSPKLKLVDCGTIVWNGTQLFLKIALLKEMFTKKR